MKKFKKLIPALCMLLVSAVMLGSTTYAWFSMNNKVTATGLNVTATANTKYLVISASNTLGTDTEIDKTTDNIPMTARPTAAGSLTGTSVYPIARATSANAASLGLTAGDWYTANSKVYDDAATSTTTKSENIANVTKIEEANLGNYVLTYTFYIGVASGSANYNGAISVKALSSSTGFGNTGLTAIVKIDGYDEVTITAADAAQTIDDVELTTTAKAVTVKLYIDGNAASVKSSTDIATIVGSLDLEFIATGITVA